MHLGDGADDLTDLLGIDLHRIRERHRAAGQNIDRPAAHDSQHQQGRKGVGARETNARQRQASRDDQGADHVEPLVLHVGLDEQTARFARHPIFPGGDREHQNRRSKDAEDSPAIGMGGELAVDQNQQTMPANLQGTGRDEQSDPQRTEELDAPVTIRVIAVRWLRGQARRNQRDKRTQGIHEVVKAIGLETEATNRGPVENLAARQQ